MKFEFIKQQLQHNRKVLSVMYDQLDYYKLARKNADIDGNLPFEYLCHKNVGRLRKQIASLAQLQKALKAAAAKELSLQRQERKCALMKQSVMANVGECF